jgi:ubiquitin-like 1-activating enzyme E1 B
LWEKRKPPVPLYLDDETDNVSPAIEGIQREAPQVSGPSVADQRVWSLEESVSVFLKSAAQLQEEGLRTKWDKDVELHLNFVTAAANIRAAIFHLEFSSRFFVKEKAGSIIPAIATTNAIIAGLIVLKAFRVLAGKLDQCRNTWLKKQPTRGMLFVGSTLDPPNPKCYVCGDHFVRVKINTETTALKFFLEEIVMKEWELRSPILSVTVEGSMKIIYEHPSDEDSEETEIAQAQSLKMLKDVYLSHDSIVYVEDQVSDLKLTASICHATFEEGAERPYEIAGAALPKGTTPAQPNETVEQEEAEESCVVVQDPKEIAVLQTQNPDESKKRKREEVVENETEAKKRRSDK